MRYIGYKHQIDNHKLGKSIKWFWLQVKESSRNASNSDNSSSSSRGSSISKVIVEMIAPRGLKIMTISWNKLRLKQIKS